MHRPPRSLVALLAAIACAGAVAVPANADPSARGLERGKPWAAKKAHPAQSHRPAGAGSGRKIG